ncbi:MAG TPA: AbiJ-NTD4 domain-containing protein [Candidatus Tripitaka californicus]|uniref:AbiJ-NTD4 domain-containing protein n=1 Tax=Candidatus Tripitaka californicus TaxID=3367616 RepID=UPI004028D922|nr:hypothetical protein [Planctomycetota bacterium]
MKKFSERIGITRHPILQLNEITPELRNCLWNLVFDYLRSIAPSLGSPYLRTNFMENLAQLFFKVPVDDIPRGETDWLKEKFFNLSWYEVYEFFEFLIIRDQIKNLGYFKARIPLINQILEEENSGYRLANGKFVPITNEQEIQAIEEAIGKAEQFGKGANEHLSQAVALFSKKPDPDYRNSIKESISAVESLVKQISGKDGDFAPALEELSKKIPLHGAMKEGFKKLYGYTSDEDGIRHAILEDPNVGFDEAKFMLVTCSAFVNFLFSKAQKSGLLKKG